jgi:hypothetical protein
MNWREHMPRWLTRIRTPATLTMALALIVTSFVGVPGWVRSAVVVVFLAGLVSLYLPAARPGTAGRPPAEVWPPVRGRWQAVNSPADRVPSHGVHAYGQTYAIDLVYRPDPGSAWSGLVRWPVARPSRAFPGFGQPVLAPADGVVVKVSAWQRDHWSRNSLPGVAYLLAEGIVREFTGPGRILGNHVVLDLGDGVYAALAHLRRRSVLVRVGQRVTAGDRLAECGNSGNSSEPHLHFQLMDHPNVLLAAGLPFRFRGLPPDGAGVPSRCQPFTVPAVYRVP